MTPDDVDVLIVGAGLSGIGAAVHLQRESPGRTYAILEGRESIGGTWDLFRYPGIRSDSDMYTLGYSFRPWTAPKAIADGPDILEYIRATARDYDVESHIRFGHRVVDAAWSSDESRWTVTADRSDGSTAEVRCRFLYFCSGYYDYERGYSPDFPGAERFGGELIHPQHWPEGTDWSGKKVVVIGSGATAVTLVPAMAPAAEHVTMLQRSPSYVIALPAKDPVAKLFHKLLPTNAAYAAIRWFKVLTTMAQLPAQPPPAEADAEVAPQRDGQAVARRLRGRRALQPDLRPVGSAPLPGPRRGSLPGPEQGRRGDRHRLDRRLRRNGHRAHLRSPPRRRHRRLRDRVSTCLRSGAPSSAWTAPRSTSRRRSVTRG